MRKPGLVLWILALLGSLVLSACGDESPTRPDRMQIDPPTASIEWGATTTFHAQLVFGSRVDPAGPPITWVARNPALAEVTTNGDGSVTVKGLGAGTTEIVATKDALTASASLTVGAPRIMSIGVTPASPQIAKGTLLELTATATFADSSTEDVSDTATWASANPAIASVAPDGTVRGVAVGSTMISATRDGITGSTTVTVTDAELVSITVTPTNPSIPRGRTQQLTATGTFTDATVQDLTAMVSWSTADATRVTVDGTGLATAVDVGSAAITATLGPGGSIHGSTTVTVTPAVLTSLAVTPVNSSAARGRTVPFVATGTYSDNTTQNLTTTVAWSSSNVVVASISNNAGSQGQAQALSTGQTIITATTGAFSNSTTFTVTPAELVSIQVTPANPSAAAGTDVQLTATGLYTDATTADLTATVAWSSSNQAVATVSNAVGSKGLVSAETVGNTTITATSGAVSGSTTVTVTAAELVSIGVTPINPVLALGRTQQFTATGVYTDNSTQDLTGSVTWASSNAARATISNAAGSRGVATALSLGPTTITATSGLIIGSTTLTVTDAELVSIGVTPAAPSVAKGLTRQFTATGTFSDMTTADLTTSVTWSSSNAAVAALSNAPGSQGLATTLAVGNVQVTATSGTVSGSTQLTVTAAELVSIGVTPVNPSVAQGLTRQFTATGVYTDASTQDLTATVAWTSSAAAVATVSNAAGSQGVATGLAVGNAQITATSGAISGSTQLTVTAAELVSIAVTPAAPSLAKGLTRQFTATGTFTDNSTADLTATVTWASSDGAVAGISNAAGSQGLATALTVGNTQISATSGAISGSTQLTVTAAELVSIGVTPAAPSLAKGLTLPFTATGTFTDATTLDLTATVTWASSDDAVASVSNAAGSRGLATALAVGNTQISATSGAVSGSTQLTVTAAELVSIGVTPAVPSVAKGLTQQFTATGTFTDASTQDLTATVTWASSAAGVATVSNAAGSRGLATTLAIGDTQISATSGAISGSTTLTVTPAVLVSIAITPAAPSVPKGLDQQLTATGTFTDASVADLTATVTWASSNEAVATVSNAAGSKGLAHAAAVGTASITATSGAISGSTDLTVTPAVIVSIGVTPAAASRPVGLTQQFLATATLSDGGTQDVTGTAAWSSTAAAVATVSNAAGSKGLATALAAGQTTIRAQVAAVIGGTTFDVTDPVLVSLAVTPPNPTTAIGQTVQFTATGTYDNATVQDLTATVTWASSDQTIATISNAAGSQGLATPLADGQTAISATLGGVVGTTQLHVSGAVVVSIAVTPAQGTLPKGRTLQYVAQATYSDASVVDVTGQAAWTSSAPAVVAVSNAAGSRGLATGLDLGTAVVTATFSGVQGHADLEVTPAVLESITIGPQVNPPLPKGLTRQYTATGHFSDATIADLTTQVTWASSDATVLAISNAVDSEGLATGLAVGSVTITATSGAIVGSKDTDVSAAILVSLAVTPVNPDTPLGVEVPMVATGTYSDATVLDLTATAVWTSGSPAVATVSNAAGSQGRVHPVGLGQTVITATQDGVSGTSTVTVSPAILVTVQVTPPVPSIALGRTQQFVATGIYSDATTIDLTGQATWASSNVDVATVSNLAPTNGLASSVTPGVTTISATFDGKTGSTQLTVTPAALESITLEPLNPSVAVGLAEQMIAVGHYSDGTTPDITTDVVWSTASPAIATIDNAVGNEGVLLGVAVGQTQVTATLDGISASTQVTVTPAILQLLTITPDTAAIAIGRTVALKAEGLFSDNTVVDLTDTVTWGTDDAQIATVSNVAPRGVVTGVGIGLVLITADHAASGKHADALVEVTNAVLDSITIAPANTSVQVGGTQTLVATGHYSDGSTRDITNDNDTLWSTANAAIASVSNAVNGKGVVTGVAAGGPVTITAAQAGKTGTAAVTVTVVPVVLSVVPANDAVNVPIGTAITVTFNTAMDATSLTVQAAAGPCTGSVQLSADNFTTCLGLGAVTMSGGNTVAASTPIGGLAFATTYRGRITTDAKSALGTPLAATVTQANGFTTEACKSGLVISQVYGAGGLAGATYSSDYVELHNTGSVDAPLAGLAIQYASTSGTTWTAKALPVATVPAGGYYLVRMTAPGANGAAIPAPDFIPATQLDMSGTNGKVALTSTTVALSGACPNANIIDFVGFGTANCFEGAAAAAAGAAALAPTRKNGGCQDANVNSTDFAAVLPSARNSASPAVLCSCTMNETDKALEMDFCNIQFPASTAVAPAGTTEFIYARVFENTFTQPAGPSAAITGQIGYGPNGADPLTAYTSFVWTPAAFNVQVGNDDEYRAQLVAPAAAGTYKYTARFTRDGRAYTYCDLDGAGANAGLTFDLPQLGTLTVQ